MPDEAPTMIIPKGTNISVDVHGQLSITTPGNLVIQNSGSYRMLESLEGSIRIESRAEVEAVHVRCGSTCFIEGSLTAWKVEAEEIHLEDDARANIVLQEAERLEIGRQARMVGNFDSEKELFLLLSRFARQVRQIPLFAELGEEMQRRELPGDVEANGDGAGDESGARVTVDVTEASRDARSSRDLPDPLFFALVLLEREFQRSAYGPTSQRAIEELVKLLQEQDVEALEPTYKSLFNRVVEPGPDVRKAHDLIHRFFRRKPA